MRSSSWLAASQGAVVEPRLPGLGGAEFASSPHLMTDGEAMEQFRRGQLVFDVRDSGPADGPVVVRLHGHLQSKFRLGRSSGVNRMVAESAHRRARNRVRDVTITQATTPL